MKTFGTYLVGLLLSLPLLWVAYLMFSVLYGEGREPLEW